MISTFTMISNIKWLCLVALVNGLEPGLRLRVTEDGLDYANKIMAESVSKDIRNNRFDEISAEAFGIQFKLTDLRVKDFKLSDTEITFGTGDELQWIANEMKLEVNGAFQYKWRIISGRGDFEMKLSDVSFNIGIKIGIDAAGKPTVKTSSCSGDIGSVRIRFFGRASWIFNILSGVTKNEISKLLQNKVCEKVRGLIDMKAEEVLCQSKLVIPLGDSYTLDYSLISAPYLTTTENLDFEMKGEVFWTRNKTEVPFIPPKMAAMTDDDKMLYLTMSDYVFNSLTYQAFKYNMLVYNLSDKNLQLTGFEDLLNTTCTDDTCIGYLIPQIRITYPNSKVEMNIKSVEAPLVSIVEDGMGVLAAMEIIMFARTPDNTINYLFKVFAILTTSLKIKLKDQMLYSTIANMGIITNVTNSAIGDIDIVALQLFIEATIKEVIKPTLNDYLADVGFPLPSTRQLEFKNSHIEFLQNMILIETDLKIIPFEKRLSKILKYGPKVKQSPKSLVI